MRVELKNISSRETTSRKLLKKGNLSFSEVLKTVEDEKISELSFEDISGEDIKELANLIEKLGSELSESPTIDNFYNYKKAIKLLIEMVKKNFETKETISRISFSKQKLYKTIEAIDENILNIGKLILSSEKNRITCLKLVNNIKGLIIDLIL